MANTENIEAKLCAYVDGDLDAAGRAEIEAHLAANPQHRSLMDELMKQRDLLRNLPRQRAPEDLFEAMNNQLERSVLLDGDAPQQAVAGQINRWPQVFAAAAVLLLAVGLAAVIYFVLPNQNQFTQYSVLTPASTSPSAEGNDTADGQNTTRPDDTYTWGGRGLESVASKAPQASVEAADALDAPVDAAAAAPTLMERSEDVFSKMGIEQSTGAPSDKSQLTNVFADSALDEGLQEKLKMAPEVPDNSMLVVVSSENPSATQDQLLRYFESNHIQWEPVVEAMPQPLDLKQNQVLMRSRQSNMNMRLKGGPIVASPAAVAPGEAEGHPAQRPAAEAKTETADAAMQQSESATPPPTSPETADAAVGFNAANDAGSAATDPSGLSRDASVPPVAPAEARIRESAVPSREVSLQGGLTTQEITAPADASTRWFIARNLTRQQVSDLNTTIAARNRVDNFNRAGNTITPAAPPIDDVTLSLRSHGLDATASQTDGNAGAADADKREPASPVQPLAKTHEPQSNVDAAGSADQTLHDAAPSTRMAEVEAPALGEQQRLDSDRQAGVESSSVAAPVPMAAEPNTFHDQTQPLIFADRISPASQPESDEQRVDVVILVQSNVAGGTGENMPPVADFVPQAAISGVEITPPTTSPTTSTTTSAPAHDALPANPAGDVAPEPTSQPLPDR